MKKKTICIIGVVIVLLICIIAYFKPLSLLDTIGENNRIDIVLNKIEYEDGKLNTEPFLYNDISEEQKNAILSLLEKYDYRRTFGTLFTDGSLTDLGEKALNICVHDDNLSDTSIIIVTSTGKIAINDKIYSMEDAEQFIKQIIEIVE